MGVWQGSGTKRQEQVLVKFTKGEKKNLEKMAKNEGLSMSEFLRRKAFNEPFESDGNEGRQIDSQKEASEKVA